MRRIAALSAVRNVRRAGRGRISRQADPADRAAGGGQRHRYAWRAFSARNSGKELGQQIIVDNRPGGALTIGLDLTAKSTPDGYTIGMGPIGALAITRHMVAKLPYDIERDFQPIALVARGHMLLAVAPDAPFKSVPELIAYAKANPGKLSNASSSNGSPGHVGGELFKYMTGTRHRARAVSRRRGGDQRPDRGPRAADVRKPEFDRAACAKSGTVRGARRSAASSARRRFPICRRSPRPACRATRRRPGPA